MSQAHTPGPWAVEDPLAFCLSIVEAGKAPAEWRFIASCPLPESDDASELPASEVIANARLIAAAPDMLAALRALVGKVAEGELFSVRVGKALAAIAKAEGRGG